MPHNNPDVVFTVSTTGVWRSANFAYLGLLHTFNATTNGTG